MAFFSCKNVTSLWTLVINIEYHSLLWISVSILCRFTASSWFRYRRRLSLEHHIWIRGLSYWRRKGFKTSKRKQIRHKEVEIRLYWFLFVISRWEIQRYSFVVQWRRLQQINRKWYWSLIGATHSTPVHKRYRVFILRKNTSKRWGRLWSFWGLYVVFMLCKKNILRIYHGI